MGKKLPLSDRRGAKTLSGNRLISAVLFVVSNVCLFSRVEADERELKPTKSKTHKIRMTMMANISISFTTLARGAPVMNASPGAESDATADASKPCVFIRPADSSRAVNSLF